MKPNAMTPPSTPRKIRASDSVEPRAISSGFTKLSMLLMTTAPQTTMKIAHPVSPCR